MTNANDNETVQERIYRIMRSKKMQQSLVAKDAGFAPKDFNNMLKGRKLIRPEHIVPLCKSSWRLRRCLIRISAQRYTKIKER